MRTARKRVMVTGAVAALGLALAGCSSIDSEALTDAVANTIEDELGGSVDDIECPEDIAAEEGESFDCTVTDADGNETDYEVEITGIDGSDVEYEVRAPSGGADAGADDSGDSGSDDSDSGDSDSGSDDDGLDDMADDGQAGDSDDMSGADGSIDSMLLEQAVANTIETEFGVTIESVDCPETIEAIEGSTVSCIATDTFGDSAQVNVTFTSISPEGDVEYLVEIA